MEAAPAKARQRCGSLNANSAAGVRGTGMPTSAKGNTTFECMDRWQHVGNSYNGRGVALQRQIFSAHKPKRTPHPRMQEDGCAKITRSSKIKTEIQGKSPACRKPLISATTSRHSRASGGENLTQNAVTPACSSCSKAQTSCGRNKQ